MTISPCDKPSDFAVLMSKASKIRPGDHVFHRPSGETWSVGRVGCDNVYGLGWPRSCGRLADCKVVYRGSDSEYRNAVMDAARSEISL